MVEHDGDQAVTRNFALQQGLCQLLAPILWLTRVHVLRLSEQHATLANILTSCLPNDRRVLLVHFLGVTVGNWLPVVCIPVPYRIR